MGKLKYILHRIYSDFFMPSRLHEYEKLLQTLKKNDFECLSFRDYALKCKNKQLQNKKYFINRHDIDTDLQTAKEFFKIEQRYKIKASYYFRLSTLDIDFMQQIEKSGSEASYHFEEIAQFSKDNHIKSSEQIISKIDEIKDIFKQNFLNIEERVGTKMLSVCSHGDFANRALKITNNLILKEPNFRQELGIEFETYDKQILSSFDLYISDNMYPNFYKPIDIFEALKNEKFKIICMLTHPRHWRANILVNFKDNIKRIYEGIKW